MEDQNNKMTDKIEINNAKEEILGIVEQCNKCGLCKENDCVFKALREEAMSSRGRATLLVQPLGTIDKTLFNHVLDGTCKQSCPFNIDIDDAIRKARRILNAKGKENEVNKEILNRIKNKQNPFLEKD